jgi:hypothetical protein
MKDTIESIIKEYFLGQVILNVSEGKKTSAFFDGLYKGKKDKSKLLAMSEVTASVIANNSNYECIQLLHVLFVQIDELIKVQQMKLSGRDPKTVRTPYDPTITYHYGYLFDVFKMHDFDKFIDPAIDYDPKPVLESFYGCFNTSFAAAIEGHPNWIHFLNQSLEIAKQYFAAKCSDGYSDRILQELIEAENKVAVLNKYRREFREIRDRILFGRIAKIVKERDVKLVIIPFGFNHYHHLKFLFESSSDPTFELIQKPLIEGTFRVDTVEVDGKGGKRSLKKRKRKRRYRKSNRVYR